MYVYTHPCIDDSPIKDSDLLAQRIASGYNFPRSARVTRVTLDVGHLLMAGENPAQSVAMAGWSISQPLAEMAEASGT